MEVGNQIDTDSEMAIESLTINCSETIYKNCKFCRNDFIFRNIDQEQTILIAKDDLCLSCNVKCRQCRKRNYDENNLYKLCSDCDEILEIEKNTLTTPQLSNLVVDRHL